MKTFGTLFSEIQHLLRKSPYIETVEKLLSTTPVKENLDKQVPSEFFCRQVISILKCRPKNLSDFLIAKIIKRSIEPYMKAETNKEKSSSSWKPIPYPHSLTWIQESQITCLDLQSPRICNVKDPLSCSQCVEGGHLCQHLDEKMTLQNNDGTKVTLPANSEKSEGYCLPRSKITESINPFTTELVFSYNDNGWALHTECKYPDILTHKTDVSNCSVYKSDICKGFPLAKYNDISKTFTTITDFDNIDFDLFSDGACNINTKEGQRLYNTLLPEENRGIGVTYRLVRDLENTDFLEIPTKLQSLYVMNKTSSEMNKLGFKDATYKDYKVIKPCKKDPFSDEFSEKNFWDATTQTCQCSLEDGFVGAYIHKRGSTGLFSDDTIYKSEPLGKNQTKIKNGEPANACVQLFPSGVSHKLTVAYGFYFENDRPFRGAIILPKSEGRSDGYLAVDRFNALSTTWRHLVDLKSKYAYIAYTEYYSHNLFGWSWNSSHEQFPFGYSSPDVLRPLSCKEQYARFPDLGGKEGITNRCFANPHCTYSLNGETLYFYNPRAAIETRYFTFINRIHLSQSEQSDHMWQEDKVPKVMYIPSDIKG